MFDLNMESNIESGTYYFTSAQEPNQDTSVFDCPDRFAIALLQKKPPALLVSGLWWDICKYPRNEY